MKNKYFIIDFCKCNDCIEDVKKLLKVAKKEGRAKISFIENEGTHIEVEDE